jgi:hypothetical protein
VSLYTLTVVFQNDSSLIAYLFQFLGGSLSEIEPRPCHSPFTYSKSKLSSDDELSSSLKDSFPLSSEYP